MSVPLCRREKRDGKKVESCENKIFTGQPHAKDWFCFLDEAPAVCEIAFVSRSIVYDANVA